MLVKGADYQGLPVEEYPAGNAFPRPDDRVFIDIVPKAEPGSQVVGFSLLSRKKKGSRMGIKDAAYNIKNVLFQLIASQGFTWFGRRGYGIRRVWFVLLK